MSDYMANHLAQLNGKTVLGVVKSEGDDEFDTFYGLRFDDGSVAWILCDPEGNGPGFLDIERGEMMEKIKANAYYGELHCPDSMLYETEDGVMILEVTLNREFESPKMTQLLAKIDLLIKSYIEVKP